MDVSYSCQGQKEDGTVRKKYTILSNLPVRFDDSGEVGYSLVNRTSDMSEADQQKMLRLVFDEINHQIWPLRIVEKEDPKEAFFKIYFVTDGKVSDTNGNHLFDAPYAFRENTLAVQYANSGSRWAGHCFINDKFLFDLYHSNSKRDITKILLHEVGGHGMGLGHSDHENEILNPIYNPDNYWTADSTRGILSLYLDQMKKVIERDERKRELANAMAGVEASAKTAKVVKKPKKRRRRRIVRT